MSSMQNRAFSFPIPWYLDLINSITKKSPNTQAKWSERLCDQDIAFYQTFQFQSIANAIESASLIKYKIMCIPLKWGLTIVKGRKAKERGLQQKELPGFVGRRDLLSLPFFCEIICKICLLVDGICCAYHFFVKSFANYV